MILKTRKKSTELKIFESLNNRFHLLEKDKLHFFNLKKGYEGEVLFDEYLEKVACECLILNDLLLQVNQTTFQIDSLLITPDGIYVFEVKNYEGDYYYEAASNQFFPKSKDVDILNPLVQLNRSETLLRQLLQSHGFKFPIKSTVVFINPQFTLYQAPVDKPFILPTQIHRLIHQLGAKRSRITNQHKALADKLMSLHLSESPYKKIPVYEYEQLRKGITCWACGSFSISVEGRSCVCLGCGHRESVSSAVLRSVSEFRLLFPGEKVTTNRIFDWCGGVVGSRKSIRSILDKYLKSFSENRWTYYQ